MKGDFSTWRYDPRDNDQGVLFQQGRVISDADLTAAERISLGWRSQAGRDILGEGVAAVPATEPGGFEVRTAQVTGGEVHLGVGPGRVWADGLLLHLPPDPSDPTAPIDRVAAYYDPPLSAAVADPATLGDGDRDAVILEVALEDLNGFQDPQRLIEPALGGPDTAERITARHDLRLVRLGPNENCQNIRRRLIDGDAGKGRLTVSLEPTTTTTGDCPVVEGGGYTGFEHNLYRVEIAEVSSGGPRFKWSQFNGGLVGRGLFHAGPPRRVEIRANRTAIVNSGLTEFYLEAIEYDAALGRRRVVYGTMATLNSEEELELSHPPVFGAFPAPGGQVFFRLWNGIRDVSEFTDATDPEELQDGIHFAFDPPAGATYRPGDYWTFTVRAGEIANDEVLIDAAPPEGPELRRVPLAEIHWTGDQDTTQSGTIHDCRRRFRPLTNQKHCCTLQVGDGITSFGDFNSVEEAAAHLPLHGGEICLLPGLHFTNLVLQGRSNIRIRGCRHRTFVLPRLAKVTAPIFTIVGGTNIELSSMDLFAPFGAAVEARGQPGDPVKWITLEDCRILARTYGARIDHGERITVARNLIWLLDLDDGKAAISLRATDALVERNALGVWPINLKPPRDDGDDDGDEADNPCTDPEEVYDNLVWVLVYVVYVWTTNVVSAPPQPYRALGGIHLRGGCERVRVLQNTVDGGQGHGITLGGLLPGDPTPDLPIDGASTAPRVTIRQEQIQGYVQSESSVGLRGVDVFLATGGTAVAQTTSGNDGFFRTKVVNGSYGLAVEPGYEIVEVREGEFEGEDFHVIVVREAAVQVPPDESFLYRITIQDNEIERMALSGVGFLRHKGETRAIAFPDLEGPESVAALLALVLAPRDLVRTTNVVQDLVIRDNRIHDNLRAVFDDALRRSARTVGQGGISLAMVESAAIHGNHIHDNGLSAVDPCCGIFVGYGEDVDISDNHIVANGPLTENYDADRTDGIRGGIFVRFASALLLGGESDALQKPALRVSDNRIDQPAGRALTVGAFGPVSVVGNYLNSEREGRWSVIDQIIGTVAILDLGGIHRQLLFGTDKKKLGSGTDVDTGLVDGGGGGIVTNVDSVPGVVGLRASPFQNLLRAELLLPGGEVLFNSNQVRMGTAHQAILSQLLLTLDDVGYDANQCSVFRPDLLFGNVVCAGHTLRATDNRFREQTQRCFLSALTYSFGLTNFAKLMAMNTTAHNQGDHCIFPLSNAPPTGLPVVDDNNLEVLQKLCRQIGDKPKAVRRYVLQALLLTLFAQRAHALTEDTLETASRQGVLASLDAIRGLKIDVHLKNRRESERLTEMYGAQAPRVLHRKARLDGHAKALAELGLQAELAGIEEIVASDQGVVFDGRVNDSAERGRAGLIVDLVRKDGTRLGISGRTDRTGYFAVALDEAQSAALAEEKEVFLRVMDAEGKEVHRVKEALEVEATKDVRTRITLPEKRPTRATREGGRVIFGGGARPRTSTPLEKVKGVGPRIAERLRAAGIPDVEALLEMPNDKLREIGGFDPEVIRKAARKALEREGRVGPGR